MFEQLRQKVLIRFIDLLLIFFIFIERIFSLKGLYKIAILGLVFFSLGRGFYVESKEASFFNQLYPPYLSLNQIEEQEPLLKDDALANFPYLQARAFLIVDLDSNTILHEKDASKRLAPASTTKLMTALVSREVYSLDERITVPEKCTLVPEMNLGLIPNEEVNYLDLLHATLISSSNDAACTLANAKMPEDRFVFLMNKKSSNLELNDTNFTNPIGFDSPDFAHYSSAYDLYKLALAARGEPLFREIWIKPDYTLNTGNFQRKIYSTNHLLTQISQTVGVKTGTTNQAGEVFIYEYLDSAEDENFLFVLMGSNNRFGETRLILNWLEENYIGS